jgi:hypothetical protein
VATQAQCRPRPLGKGRALSMLASAAVKSIVESRAKEFCTLRPARLCGCHSVHSSNILNLGLVLSGVPGGPPSCQALAGLSRSFTAW